MVSYIPQITALLLIVTGMHPEATIMRKDTNQRVDRL